MVRTARQDKIILLKVEISALHKRLARNQELLKINKTRKLDTTNNVNEINRIKQKLVKVGDKLKKVEELEKKYNLKKVEKKKNKQTPEQIKERRAEIIECTCGSTFRRSNLAKHLATAKHKKSLE